MESTIKVENRTTIEEHDVYGEDGKLILEHRKRQKRQIYFNLNHFKIHTKH